MLNPIITNNLQKIKEICKTYSVKSLLAFGSVTRDDYQFYSDVDLLVEFEKDEDNNEFSENFFWLKEELIYALKKPVDLLFLRTAMKSRLKDSIIKEKVLVYGREIN